MSGLASERTAAALPSRVGHMDLDRRRFVARAIHGVGLQGEVHRL